MGTQYPPPISCGSFWSIKVWRGEEHKSVERRGTNDFNKVTYYYILFYKKENMEVSPEIIT
jgi:hypothetical protein